MGSVWCRATDACVESTEKLQICVAKVKIQRLEGVSFWGGGGDLLEVAPRRKGGRLSAQHLRRSSCLISYGAARYEEHTNQASFIADNVLEEWAATIDSRRLTPPHSATCSDTRSARGLLSSPPNLEMWLTLPSSNQLRKAITLGPGVGLYFRLLRQRERARAHTHTHTQDGDQYDLAFNEALV